MATGSTGPSSPTVGSVISNAASTANTDLHAAVSDLNVQLKHVQAQLEMVKKDQIAQFTAQFLQAKAFLANPLTSAQGALMQAQFTSKKVFTALAEQLPFYDQFKQIQHLDAAAELGKLETTIGDAAKNMANTAAQQVTDAVTDQVKAVADHATAVVNQATALANQVTSGKALTNAITNQVDHAVVNTLASAKSAADAAVNQANVNLTNAIGNLATKNSAVATATAVLGAITGFMSTLSNIAKGTTHSAITKNSGKVDTKPKPAAANTTATSTSTSVTTGATGA